MDDSKQFTLAEQSDKKILALAEDRKIHRTLVIKIVNYTTGECDVSFEGMPSKEEIVKLKRKDEPGVEMVNAVAMFLTQMFGKREGPKRESAGVMCIREMLKQPRR